MKIYNSILSLFALGVFLAAASHANADCLSDMSAALCKNFGNYISARAAYDAAKLDANFDCIAGSSLIGGGIGGCQGVYDNIQKYATPSNKQCNKGRDLCNRVKAGTTRCSQQTVQSMHNFANTATSLLNQGTKAFFS